MLLFFTWPMDMGSLAAGAVSAYVAYSGSECGNKRQRGLSRERH